MSLGQHTLAQEKPTTIIQTAYVDTYTLDSTTDVKVSRRIELTNKTAELYVSQYELTFTNPDLLRDIAVFEEERTAEYTQMRSGNNLRLSVQFANPAIGKEAKKTLTVFYTLKDYLNQSGISRELFIPLSRKSSQEELTNYTVRVVTPEGFPTVGITKPRVTKINANLFEWQALERAEKAFYISFSDRSYYRINLNYVLSNNALYPKKIVIPLLPEGIYQKMYLEELQPPPESVFMDEDGNYLATYTVPSNSAQKVLFVGYAELFTTPRQEVRQFWQEKFKNKVSTRYLTQENYWYLNSQSLEASELTKLKGGLEVYNYVVEKLSYDTSRINRNLKRMGAAWILNHPSEAVCMEYSDLFIALSREKGIPAREVVGYGITNDQSILPLSFLGDVLHAWPEHYDFSRQTWLPADPTWGDTSGIDYYSSFDLSHIAFVYHGQDPSFPLPPGVYKLDPTSRDVIVEGVETIPKETNSLEFEAASEVRMRLKQKSRIPIIVKSGANHFLYGTKLQVVDQKSGQILSQRTLSVVEPLSSRKVLMEIPATQLTRSGKHNYKLMVNNKEALIKAYTVQSDLEYFFKTYTLIISGGFFLVVIFFLVKWHF